MTDNFHIIIQLLNFDSEDDFYFLQILQRKKENEMLGSNSHVVKNYYIKSVEQLEKNKNEIVQLCEIFNARAMIRLNRRSFTNVAFKAMVNLANTISNKDFGFCHTQYDSACGQGHNEKNKSWILDIYQVGRTTNDLVIFIERECDPIGFKFITVIPSKNGVHLITRPFNTQQFGMKYPEIEVHKDNPTNLYIP